jgi:hypothetical protein
MSEKKPDLIEEYQQLKEAAHTALLRLTEAEAAAHSAQESYAAHSARNRKLISSGAATVEELQASEKKCKEADEIRNEAYNASSYARAVYIQADHIVWQFDLNYGGLLELLEKWEQEEQAGK